MIPTISKLKIGLTNAIRAFTNGSISLLYREIINALYLSADGISRRTGFRTPQSRIIQVNQKNMK